PGSGGPRNTISISSKNPASYAGLLDDGGGLCSLRGPLPRRRERSSRTDHETHLSAPQHTPPKDARVSRPHEDDRRGQGAGEPPPQRALAPRSVDLQEVRVRPRPFAFPSSQRLRKRSDFLRVQASGHRLVLPSFVVLMYARPDDAPARLGITVTR